METPNFATNPFRDPTVDAGGPNYENEQPGSHESSQPGSAGPGRSKGKKSVGFSSHAGELVDTHNRPKSFKGPPLTLNLPPLVIEPSKLSPSYIPEVTPTHSRQGSVDDFLQAHRAHLPDVPQELTDELRAVLTIPVPPPRPRPAIRRGDSALSVNSDVPAENDGTDTPQTVRAREAYLRGIRLEKNQRIRSAPTSRRSSPDRASFSRNTQHKVRTYDAVPKDVAAYTDSDDSEDDGLLLTKSRAATHHAEAAKLVRSHTKLGQRSPQNSSSALRSGVTTPIEEQMDTHDYVPKPEQYRGGILSSLLRLYNQQPGSGSHSRSGSASQLHGRAPSFGTSSVASTPQPSPPTSGATTPIGGRSGRHWYSPKYNDPSQSSLACLVGTSSLGVSAVSGLGEEVAERLRRHQAEPKRPGYKRSASSGAIRTLNRLSRPRLEEEIRITVHIAETISRQKYLMKLCRALMQYGAPTHRLEEYMKMSARVLEIEAQFLYIPGSMIISFDDTSTHTTEVKLVRIAQGLDLGKLRDTHEVYKDVVHDRIGVEEATQRLDEVNTKAPKHSPWVLIPVYGLASASVGPFAFGARLIDLPVAFLLGCILGVLQLVVAPRSDLYANVFEISAAVITSFLARGFGSIRGGNLFCFSALAQSSIALILPGYTVLCASLELQSRSIVAGSVRMVYAIIYSLFLGFGITIGTAMYGIMDSNATSATTCENSMDHYHFFAAVPIFTMCLIVINQGKWKQAPIMLLIAFTGYVVNYFSSKRFSGNTQVSNTLGALAIGVMANLHSRIGQRVENRFWDLWEESLRPRLRRSFVRLRRNPDTSEQQSTKIELAEAGGQGGAVSGGNQTHDNASTYVRRTRRVGYGLAAAAMLPAIFVQVPSGLAVSGSLVSGLASANQITGNATNGTTVVSSTLDLAESGLNSIAFNVGYSVIQVAIGITVGLFLSAIIVYPFGKRRSGLFSF